MRRFIQRLLNRGVYVVIANEEHLVKRCEVYSSFKKAKQRFDSLKETYGGANVCLASRLVNVPPEWVL